MAKHYRKPSAMTARAAAVASSPKPVEFVRRYWRWLGLAYLTLLPEPASDLAYAVGSRLNDILDTATGSF